MPPAVTAPQVSAAASGQFKWFCREIDGGERSINGKLIADISLKNIPYSSVTILYCGIFDGNGYTISDMTMITDQNLASGERVYQYYGLFGGLGAGAVVMDLTLRGSITCTTAATQIGSVAGYATGGARITNVTSYVNIGDGGQKLDGIQKVGGIVGCAKDGSSVTVVENCQYYGKINLTSASEVGGIVGYAADNSQTVGCCNHGSVYVGSGYHTGGIVGAGFSGALIERCMNFGSVEMHNHDCLGGILGYANAKVVIRNCGNVGTVSGHHSSTDSPDAYVGGILGYVNNSNFGGLTGCYNYGTVSATQNDTYCGAIVGWGRSGATYTKITNNYYLEGEKPFGTINDAGVTAVSANRDQFASGEVAYMLNGGVTDGTQAWYQRIGSDASPKLSGGTVYFEDGGYNNGAVTVSVEISWTSMEFTYTDGDWDSNTHDYGEGQWSTEGGTITVRNTASAQVSVELDFAPTVEGLTGTLTKRSMLLGENESDTTALALAGRPRAEISNAAIGEVTVTIAQPTSEAPKEGE